MFTPQINLSYSIHNLLPLPKPFVSRDAINHSSSSAYSTTIHRQHTKTTKSNTTLARSTSSCKIKAVSIPFLSKTTPVKCEITVKPTISSAISGSLTDDVIDTITDFFGRSFLLELVSNDLQWKSVTAYARYISLDYDRKLYVYECTFEVPENFGEIGAVVVENEYHKKMFFNSIVFDNGVTFTCNSWVPSKHDNNEEGRIFFTDKSYLPSKTPEGLRLRRKLDLEYRRGTGQGERKSFERIYDYDVYNDLGNPDQDISLARPVLGGEKLPYPRRGRTGRPLSHTTDPTAETISSDTFYVPLDEDFSEIKDSDFKARAVYAVLHGLLPFLETQCKDKSEQFPLFSDIDKLYDEGVNVPTPDEKIQSALPRLFKPPADKAITADTIFKFETPEIMDRDKFSWLSDEEFCRQMLAGLNPCNIQLVTEWPLMSKLDDNVYGPAESAITKELVEEMIGGSMTIEEALAQKKLFMLDYHDLLLPYVNKTRQLKETTLYGSRTLMFLTYDGTLKPLAIELTRPPSEQKPQWKHVYTPTREATTGSWLWKLAKAHVLAHDSGIHQLVSHWLRTHCATEPYIIATHRQLSQMHPIHRLLIPHFRYTMQMNALARESLINANGIIESTFSPGKYCMQLSSDVYRQLWRFDHEALPADLISRGMAVEDPTEPFGVKLTIEDYPFANDGLLVYDAIKQWATSYVKHYYPQVNLVESDEELQAWWYEIRTVGHGDKKDEPWWPQLKTQDDLIQIVSTIMWVTSGQHSAVNFGQYDFAGYFPNRPTIARTKMPNEDPTDKEWQSFINRPEDALLRCFPTKLQAIQVMAVLEVLSSHSCDEEYIGENIEASWKAEPAIKAAFEEFQGRLKKLGDIVDQRNTDAGLRNRCGAGLVPYELLKPYSDKAGVTGKGIPNSISI